ncbi:MULTISPECIES: hypothetical protein [Sphingobium]|uniref:Uncharacterized protein n=1 Tax=Sphingobium baderi LL03 TaxID=1114964 RepID=T0I6B8_9SPHN|nr:MULTISPECIES: hypothetical protein [Sphingobium]AMK26229.1 hypothetical protein K426_26650 [Sphingobium sp. TKS]EQB05184.1 hypothetical protein L485_03430 [Sphingobium baderi LL03]KMS59062.1 hypothetical protein V475_20745 [Sphingobium baderi LL03]WRD78891.1 hypothetical protein QQ987_19705 [Sphingobium baderi]
MYVLSIIIESVGLVVGSVVLAGSLCWLAVRLHHTRWAPFLVVILLPIVPLSSLNQSEFARLSAICVLVGALFLWLFSGADRAPPHIGGE